MPLQNNQWSVKFEIRKCPPPPPLFFFFNFSLACEKICIRFLIIIESMGFIGLENILTAFQPGNITGFGSKTKRVKQQTTYPLMSHLLPYQAQPYFAVHFYIALFSALKQTHCAFVACDSKWVTVTFYSTFLSGVPTMLFGFYMAGATWNCCHFSMFCVHHIARHHFMSLHAKLHVSGACVFSCNMPPALLAEWPGSFTCYCSNTGVERILK